MCQRSVCITLWESVTNVTTPTDIDIILSRTYLADFAVRLCTFWQRFIIILRNYIIVVEMSPVVRTGGRKAQYLPTNQAVLETDRMRLGISLSVSLFFLISTMEHRAPSWVSVITHTIKTHGRTPLLEESAGHRDLYLHRTTTHKHKRHTSMPRAGFQPATPENNRP
jgi:hypothetical protein